MKTLCWILTAALAVLPATFSRAQDKTPPALKGAGASAGEIQELQKKRIAALKEVAEASQKLANRNRVDIEVALEDRMALLQAELDAAATEAERNAIDKQALESLAALQELAQARKEAARGTQMPIFRIEACRREIEKRLEPAKAKEFQKQRIESLEGLADVTARMVKAGRRSPEEMYEAKLLLLQAEADGAETESERAAVARRTIDALKGYQDVAEAQKASARGTELAVQRIAARRLAAEIGLDPAMAGELRKERIAILKSLADGAERMFKDARVPVAVSYEARLSLLEAEIDAAETASDRVELEKNLVSVLKEYETLVTAPGATASGSEETSLLALRIAARRLAAEAGVPLDRTQR